MSINFRNIIKPYPSPIITGRGIDLDFPMLAGCLALLGLGLVMITSASSEVAAHDQGAHVTYIDPVSSQIGHKESMKDTARAGRLRCHTTEIGRASCRERV